MVTPKDILLRGLVAGGMDQFVRVWAEGWELLHPSHYAPVSCLCVVPAEDLQMGSEDEFCEGGGGGGGDFAEVGTERNTGRERKR